MAGATATDGFASLGSGSRGNGTLVRIDGQCILVDCGFTLKETTARLARLGLVPDDIDAVLVTHEHTDHIGGVARLARRHRLPVYLTYGTLRAHRDWKGVDLQPFDGHKPFSIAAVEVDPVPVPHDAREPVQFVLAGSRARIGVLTDLGHITDVVVERFGGCDALLVEANHDLDMLMQGPYPWPLKRRISSPHGHLSNQQTAGLLERIALPADCALVIGHVSEQNNAISALENTFAAARERFRRLRFADQAFGTAWTDL